MTPTSDHNNKTADALPNYPVRLRGGFALLFLILLAGESLIIFFGSGVQFDIEQSQERYARNVEYFGQIQTDINLLRVYIRDEVYTLPRTQPGGPSDTAINTLVSKVKLTVLQYEPTLIDKKETSDYEGFADALNQYIKVLYEILNVSDQGDYKQAQTMLTEKLGPQRRYLEDKMVVLMKENEQIAATLENGVKNLQSKFLWLGVLILVSSLVIGSLVYFFIARSFRNYINSIISAQKEKEKLLDLLKERQGRIEELMFNLDTSIENERKRFAYELHDAIGHGLTTAIFNIDSAVSSSRGESTTHHQYLSNALQSIKESLAETKRISYELRPPILDDFGLARALEQLAIDFETRTGIRIEAEFSANYPRLNSRMEISLYRIVQEALTNIEKHSAATQVSLQSLCRNDGTIALSISDNGKGFDALKLHLSGNHHLGIKHITERIKLLGGTSIVDSIPGKGTEINIEIPSVQAGNVHD